MLRAHSSHYSEQTLDLFSGSGKMKPQNHLRGWGTCFVVSCVVSWTCLWSHGTSHILEKERSPLFQACPAKAVCCCTTVGSGLFSSLAGGTCKWHSSTCYFLQDKDGSLARLREALTGDLARPEGYRLFQIPGASMLDPCPAQADLVLEEGQVSFIHRTLCLQGGKKFK